MVKKIAALAGGAALLLGVALPVLALTNWMSKGDITVTNTGVASQTTTTKAKANTGFNKSLFGGSVTIGCATAVSGSGAWANIYTTVVGGF